MFIIFFFLWVLFNGRLTVEIAVFGMAASLSLYAFLCKFMGYRPRTDLDIMRNLFRGIQYGSLLIVEVFKATVQVVKLVLSPRMQIEPVLIHFRTGLKSELSRVALASSITLTPGTITCNLTQDGEFVVHCLDESMAEGISESSFVQLLRKMEG